MLLSYHMCAQTFALTFVLYTILLGKMVLICFYIHFTCSTREIKPNQQDIGRKIITKKPASTITPAYNNRTGPTLKRSLDGDFKNDVNNSLSHLAPQQQIPTINSHSNYSNSQDHLDSYHQSNHHNINPIPINGVVGDDVDHQRPASMIGINLNRNSNGQQNHRNPDIMRKPIK
jgi:hypothetical protein